METRMKKFRQVSPERAKVWTEKSPKYQQIRKVTVVYYLSRNRQLEHPHFIGVPLSSPDDVIERLNVLRGRGMAAMYSWSCKRSCKNGFVWHDLSDDDLIVRAHGNEYVLKGSELFDESTSDHLAPVVTTKKQNLIQLPEPTSSRCLDDDLSPSKSSHEDELELSPPVQRPCSSSESLESRDGKNSAWNGSLSLTEYKVHKNKGLSDASTQTEENSSRPKTRETCTRGVSTDDGSSDSYQNHVLRIEENTEISENPVSPPPSSTTSSSGGKTETLKSLIRADVNKINSFRILEGEEIRIPNPTRLKASDMLMQLISCGSISVKDHSFGIVPTYRPRFSDSKFGSPFFSASFMLGELDCLTENPRLRLEDKEYFSSSLIQTKFPKEEEDRISTLKLPSSYNADRISKKMDSAEENESTSGRTKCIPISIKASMSKPKGESMRSPVSHSCSSNGSSRRITEPISIKKQSKKVDSFREEKEKVIKIEESLLQELGL